MTVREALRHGAATLEAAGVDNPRLDARLLLAHALGTSSEGLLLDPGRHVDAAGYDAVLRRRAAREPLALILGRREFWSLDFAVSPATLIPRGDSETLIETAQEVFAQRPPPRRILDLGTGTGCLLLAALAEFSSSFGIGIDRSPAAAALAACNAAMLGMERRAAILCGDWATAVNGRFDLVLSNPPYIASGELNALMPEVARYEPHAALDGGMDGLNAYRHLISELARLLTPDGVAIFEVGRGQAEAVSRLARSAGLACSSRADLNGIERALVLRLASP